MKILKKFAKLTLFALFICLNLNNTYSKQTQFSASKFMNIKFDGHSKFASTQAEALKRIDFSINHELAKEVFLSGNTALKITGFPINNLETGNLILKYQRPIDDRNTLAIAGGKRITLDLMTCYYGTIEGQENSDVFITYSPSGIVGHMTNQSGEQYNISYNREETNLDPTLHTMSLTAITPDFYKNFQIKYCGSKQENTIPYHDEGKKENQIQSTEEYEVTYAVEGDFFFFALMVTAAEKKADDFWYQNKTYIARAINYQRAILAYTSRLYERQLNCFITVNNYILQSDYDADPWTVKESDDLSIKLGYMPTVWSRPDHNFKRTFATLFCDTKKQPASSRILGIAWRGSNPTDGSYCETGSGGGYCCLGMYGAYTFPNLQYTEDVATTAHEFGHNFSSGHTHDCNSYSPPIDTCVTVQGDSIGDACLILSKYRKPDPVGTLMSYCHLHLNDSKVLMQFHPRCVTVMRSALERAYLKPNKGSQCILSQVTKPSLRLTTMWGDQTFSSGSQENVAFNAVKVNLIDIYFSSDNGKTWTKTDSSISTLTDSVYQWTVPLVSTTTGLLKIQSSTDTSIHDQSVVTFTIKAKFVKFTGLKNGAKLGARLKNNIAWTKALVTNVSLAYSTNNGTNWIQLLTPQAANVSTAIVNFGSQILSNAILKVYDPTDETSYDQITFSTENEYIKFSYPAAGQKFCANTPFTITWSNNLVNTMKFWLASDNGADWTQSKNLLGNIAFQNAGDLKYTYKTGVAVGNQYKLRATQNNNPMDSIIFDESGTFEFVTCPAGVEDHLHNDFKLNILDIQPNPANDFINIKLENNLDFNANFSLDILDLTGKTALSIGMLSNITSGDNIIPINIKNLSSGSYTLIIKAGEYWANKQLIISK